MEKEVIHINSIAEVYDFLKEGNPPHPLVTVIRKWPKFDLEVSELKVFSDLYFIAYKSGISGSFKYGRNSYDYQEGTIVFTAPGQIATYSLSRMNEARPEGWAILFHPDLIRKSELGKKITQFSFFHYDTHEALHLSEKERQFLSTLVDTIELEISQNIDRHSQELIVQNIETILKYCNRYYDRQFYTRTSLNQDLISKFEHFLKEYFASTELQEKGIPTLNQCGEALNMSGAYLSDLLRSETGRSALDHIHNYLIDHAMTSLLSSSEPVSQVAYQLGFEYPQNFSKLFKSKTGMSPSEYRNLN